MTRQFCDTCGHELTDYAALILQQSDNWKNSGRALMVFDGLKMTAETFADAEDFWGDFTLTCYDCARVLIAEWLPRLHPPRFVGQAPSKDGAQ